MTLTDLPQRRMSLSDRRRILGLIVGDTISFLVFASVGRSSHGEASGFGAISLVFETALPFILGWLVIAPFVGAFRTDPTEPPLGLLRRSALAWLIAWPICLGLRALIRQSSIPWTFALVVFITNMLLLLAWRAVFTWVTRRRGTASSAHG